MDIDIVRGHEFIASTVHAATCSHPISARSTWIRVNASVNGSLTNLQRCPICPLAYE